jgi:hypothetical protein
VSSSLLHGLSSQSSSSPLFLPMETVLAATLLQATLRPAPSSSAPSSSPSPPSSTTSSKQSGRSRNSGDGDGGGDGWKVDRAAVLSCWRALQVTMAIW